MLTIATREQGGVTIIDLDGQIDGGPQSAKIHEFMKQNLAQGRKQFVLNLKSVKWLNSLGAGILIAAYVSAKRENAALKVFGVSEPNGKKLDNLYKLAWVRGLKTTYYLRSLGATHVEKSTMDEAGRANKLNAVKVAGLEAAGTAPKACSLLDPDCEACQ